MTVELMTICSTVASEEAYSAMSMFETRISLKELITNVTVEVDVRIEVKQTADGYEASNPYASPIVSKGATPLEAVMAFLSQQLHTTKALTFEKGS